MDLISEVQDCEKIIGTDLDAESSGTPETSDSNLNSHPGSSNEVLQAKEVIPEAQNLVSPTICKGEEENAPLTKESVMNDDLPSNSENLEPSDCEEASSQDTHNRLSKKDVKESFNDCTSIKTNGETVINNEDVLEISIIEEKSNIYCSTPVVSNIPVGKDKLSLESDNDFGKMSPLKSNKNLKRKNLGLECIEELDEDVLNSCVEKKSKLSEPSDEQDISSSVHCFEAPAKSILKKWHPSCLSRNSSSSFVVLDECGNSDSEESVKPNHDTGEPALDDFEIACKSLTEELMKSSSNIDTLQKYYSQVQLESQMDNDRFDSVLQELSLNCELDEKTSLSLKSMEDSDVDKTVVELNDAAELSESNTSVEADITVIEVKGSSNAIGTSVLDEGNTSTDKPEELENKDYDNSKITIQSKEGVITDTPSSTEIKRKQSILDRLGPEPAQTSNSENRTIIFSDGGKDMTMDEEDFLLDEDTSVKKKPYVFFEFVSSDPKENEDNYNPEWQKLGQLTSDGERYKAVRDRWRSLKPPDPNKDLTCRQWRAVNKKPALNLPSRNNNLQMYMDSDRNQLCTAVFEMKIKRMVQDLDDARMKILRQRNRDFEELALAQDQEQRMMSMRGASGLDLAILHKHHIEECRNLKAKHDLELNKITATTEDKIHILKEASEEVLLFQKFYKGVGEDDQVCMYMTDIQVQELMETEEMLEQYTQFYR